MKELPSGWAWAPIGELGQEYRQTVIPVKGQEYQLWSVPAFANGEPEVRLGETIGSSKLSVQAGDVLICKINPRINRVWMVQSDSSGRSQIASPEWLVLRLPEGLRSTLGPYISLYLSSPSFREWITGAVSGVTGSHARAKAKDILHQSIPLPPLNEQRRIIVALEEYLPQLARAESQRVAAAKRVEYLRNSILNAAVMGSLTDPSSRVCDYPVGLEGRTGKKIDYSSLFGLPCGWSWRVAEEICEKIACGGTPTADLMHAGSGDIPFLKVYNLTRDGRVDFTVRPTFIDSSTHRRLLKRSSVRPGDVLTNIVGPPLGKTAVVPKIHQEWNINQAIVVFRAGPEVSPSWLALALQSPVILRLLRETARATAGQFNVALSTCRELPIPVPPRPVQDEICHRAAELLSSFEKLQRDVMAAEAWCVRLRAQIMQEAFAGRLVRQDLADEPAVELLDRIRTERAARVPMPRMRRSKGEKTPQKETLL